MALGQIIQFSLKAGDMNWVCQVNNCEPKYAPSKEGGAYVREKNQQN